jgi:hypothetical protein
MITIDVPNLDAETMDPDELFKFANHHAHLLSMYANSKAAATLAG